MTAIALTPADLATASLLVLAAAGLSLRFDLGVHRDLLVSALRLVLQLTVVGLLLRKIFDLAAPGPTLAVVAVMLAAAAREVVSRQERRLAGGWNLAIGGITVAAGTLLVTALALTTALRPEPWYAPRYAIALTGIVLGTVMNGASLALNGFYTAAARERNAIEARLALGQDRATALRPLLRQAVRNGMIPVVNQMAAAGIITLPGVMTGQILGGMDPMAAVRYQILLMFLLTGGGFIGVVTAVQLASRRLTDARHRLRLDRLVLRAGSRSGRKPK